MKGAIKQIYFLSTYDVNRTDEVNLTQCGGIDQNLLWKTYLSRIKGKKNVMLLLDHGGSLSRQQLKILKALGKNYIQEDFILFAYY